MSINSIILLYMKKWSSDQQLCVEVQFWLITSDKKVTRTALVVAIEKVQLIKIQLRKCNDNR